MKKSLEKRLQKLEDEHGPQEISDGLCLRHTLDSEFSEAEATAAEADWHARWRLGHTNGLFILGDHTVADFKRRLENALGRLEDERGTRVSVDEFIQYIHTARTSDDPKAPVAYFDGRLSNKDADSVSRWTVQQESEYGEITQ